MSKFEDLFGRPDMSRCGFPKKGATVVVDKHWREEKRVEVVEIRGPYHFYGVPVDEDEGDVIHVESIKSESND